VSSILLNLGIQGGHHCLTFRPPGTPGTHTGHSTQHPIFEYRLKNKSTITHTPGSHPPDRPKTALLNLSWSAASRPASAGRRAAGSTRSHRRPDPRRQRPAISPSRELFRLPAACCIVAPPDPWRRRRVARPRRSWKTAPSPIWTTYNWASINRNFPGGKKAPPRG